MSEIVQSQSGRDGSAIVLIHGDFGDGQDSWGLSCDLIGRRYRTVVVDRPGTGVHPGPDDSFAISGEARYVLEAVDELGHASFHLVGHSYGALIAIEMAISRPDMVRSLHLVEPPLLGLLPDQPPVRDMDRRVREIVENHATRGDVATTEAFFSMIGADRAVERLRGTPEWDRLCGHATRFARSQLAGDYPSQTLDRLPRTIPVTLYTGGRSHPALRLIVTELANRIEHACLVDVAEAGHAVQMSGAAFVDALLEGVTEADHPRNERELVAAADSHRE
jgi:pimeloyl-ACP methyl ester carboxylesterase